MLRDTRKRAESNIALTVSGNAYPVQGEQSRAMCRHPSWQKSDLGKEVWNATPRSSELFYHGRCSGKWQAPDWQETVADRFANIG